MINDVNLFYVLNSFDDI